MNSTRRNRRSPGGFTLIEVMIALFVIAAGNLDFDQFVTVQATLDFLHHGFGETCITDHDHGVERVGLGTQKAALTGG